MTDGCKKIVNKKSSYFSFGEGFYLPYTIIFFVFSLNPHFTFAQKLNLDSLVQLFKQSEEGVYRVDIANEMTMVLIDSDLTRALEINNENLELARKISYTKGLAAAHLNLARIYMKKEKPDQFYAECKTLMKMYKKSNDIEGQALVYEMRGKFNQTMQNVHNAHQNFLQAMALFEKTGNKKKQASCLMGLGNLYYLKDEYQKAESFYTEASKIYNGLKDKGGKAYVLGSLGNIYDVRKEYDLALKNYLTALNIYRQLSKTGPEIWMMSNIGATYYNLKKYPESLAYLNKAEQMANQNQKLNYLIHIYDYLSKVNKALGNMEEAFSFKDKYVELKDSLDNTERSDRFLEMENRFKFELKEQEIRNLKQEKLFKEKVYQTRVTILLLFLFSVGVFGIFYYVNARNLKKMNTLLDQKNQLIHQQFEELSALNENLTRTQGELQLQKDLLEKKNNEIININSKLEQLIDEKNSDLQVRYRQINDYAFMNAHRLRAPLANLLGLVDLVRSEYNAEEIRSLVDKIGVSADKLDDIVREIQDIVAINPSDQP